jgi:hypothetical protein
MLALMRYGAGLPMYRTGKWQSHFGVPLPASTQWELIEAASETPQVIYEILISLAAQGHLLFNDDTHMRVQSVRKEIAAAGSEQERTGIFTTSIVSKTGPRCSVPRFSRELFPNDFVGNREAVPECCVVVLSC